MKSRYHVYVLIFLLIVSTVHAISLPQNYSNQVTLYIPAVEKMEEGYRGVLATLTVMIRPGHGRVFVDTLPLTEIDTQAGARVAKEAVEDLLKVNLNNYDLFYIIRSDSPIVGGPSAGGAMAVGTLAAVLNLSIDKSVVMTGTINPDGSIGPVGGLLEKAQAVAEHNGTIFLIPEGQSVVRIQKTEKTEFPFGVEIISKPVTINLKEYAKKKWNLTVEEVSNIKEAMEYMTGYTVKIKREKVNTTTELKNVMKTIAEKMMDETKRKYNETSEVLRTSTIPYEYETELENMLKKEKSDIDKIDKFYQSENYYSAASICFSSLVQLSRIEYVIKFLESSDREAFLENKLSNIQDQINDVYDDIREEEREIDNINDIEVIAIASERLSDAKNSLKNAWKEYYNGKYLDSIYYLSYAEERAKTSETWLSLTKTFSGEKINVSIDKFREIATMRIGEALSLITYAQLLNADTSKAEERISMARADFDSGNYLSSLFNAITAIGDVDVTLKINGLSEGEIKQRLDYVDARASEEIADAQSYGCVPILAFSYYEYARSLKDTDAISSMLYFTYAKYFAKTSKNLAEVFKGKKFGLEKNKIEIVPSHRYVKKHVDISVVFIVFLVGFVVGFIVRRK